MNLTTEQIERILDGAPDGATHYCSNKEYWRVSNGEWQVREHGHDGYYWTNESPIYLKWIKHLNDLRTITQQAEEIERLRKQLDDFYAIVNESNGVAGWHLNGDIATWEELELLEQPKGARL